MLSTSDYYITMKEWKILKLNFLRLPKGTLRPFKVDIKLNLTDK